MGSYIDLVYIWGLIFSQVAGVMSFSHFPTAALLADSNSLTYTFTIVVYVSLVQTEIKMKRLESPPSGHFMIVARVPVAPPTIRRHTVSKTKPVL